jgi:uncharacterized protein (DUF433 family)
MEETREQAIHEATSALLRAVNTSDLEAGRVFGMVKRLIIARPPSAATVLGLNGNAVVRSTKRRAMSSVAVIHSDPEILGGTPVFVGTRVPFRNLIDYLERNHSLDEFLDAFPTVSREQAVAALETAHDEVTARARSAR